MPLRALLLAVLLAWRLPSWAADAGGSANLLRLPVGPRQAGFGGAFTGLADDVNAIGYNPAGLALLTRHEATLMHNELFTGVRQEWLAVAVPTKFWGTWAASAHVLHVEPFDILDADALPAGGASAQDSAYGLSYARSFGRLSLGITGRWLHSRLNDAPADAWSLDAGALVETPLAGVRLGLAAVNMGAGFRYRSENEELPLGGRAGLSYVWNSYEQGEGREHQVIALGDMTAYNDRSQFFSGGVEYLRHRVLALRAGFNGGDESGSGLTLGAGVYVNRGRRSSLTELDFDYAFIKFGSLGDSHRVSVTLKFGKPKWLKVEEIEARSAEKTRPKAPAEKRKPRAPESDQPRWEPASQEKTWVNP